MNLTLQVAQAALLLVLFMLPGFLFRRSGMSGEKFTFVLSQLLIYIAQPALYIKSFLRAYDSSSMRDFAAVAAVTLIVLIIGFLVTDLIYPQKIPDSRRKVLRFGTIFSNTGNIGLPLIIYTIGYEYAFYVQASLIVSNFIAYSFGRYLYSEDKKHISFLGSIFNPGMFPSIIGFTIYITGLGGWIANAAGAEGFAGAAVGLVSDLISGLGDMVVPVAMLIIGARLADLSLKGVFDDAYLYLQLFLKLILLPAFVAGVVFLFRRIGAISPEICALLIILFSTPSASLTSALAELHNCDSAYGSKLVAVSTVLSAVTMPLMVLLLI